MSDTEETAAAGSGQSALGETPDDQGPKTSSCDDPLRGTGRTTALMLHAIADALEHPDDHVEFRDHYPMTYARAATLLAALRHWIAALHLTIDTAIIKVDDDEKHVVFTLRSPISRIRKGGPAS